MSTVGLVPAPPQNGFWTEAPAGTSLPYSSFPPASKLGLSVDNTSLMTGPNSPVLYGPDTKPHNRQSAPPVKSQRGSEKDIARVAVGVLIASATLLMACFAIHALMGPESHDAPAHHEHAHLMMVK